MSEPREELTITVGAKEIYDKVVETAADVKEIKESRADHETRIRALEHWRYAIVGSPVVAGVVSYFTQRGKA